ncbi:MAG: hypothetical protein ACLRSP_02205 [Flavonifractor plautii]
MANFQNNAITDSGRALLSHVQMGAVFTPTKIVVGSGYMPPGKTARTMTDVVTPVKNLTINKKQRTNDGKAIFGGVYSNQDISQDWYFRELALYAKAVYPEGQEIAECLYSYGNAGDQADLMPAYTTGQPVERQMDLVVYVGNDAKVDLTIESGVYLTQEQAEKMIAEALADIDLDITDDTTGLKYRWGIQSGNAYLKESETEDKKLLVVMASQVGKPNGVAGLDGSGKVPAGQLPKMDYDPAGSAEAVQQALTAHTGNKNNPHAVTVEQVGALASSGGVMSGAISMSGHKIANLAAPTDLTDAAHKSYVDEHVDQTLKQKLGYKLIKEYTSPGSYTHTFDRKYTDVFVVVVGAGGGGSSSGERGGGGGGGGAVACFHVLDSSTIQNNNIVVGTGGAGAVSSLGPSVTNNGSAGGSSSAFGITVPGGSGGIANLGGMGGGYAPNEIVPGWLMIGGSGGSHNNNGDGDGNAGPIISIVGFKPFGGGGGGGGNPSLNDPPTPGGNGGDGGAGNGGAGATGQSNAIMGKNGTRGGGGGGGGAGWTFRSSEYKPSGIGGKGGDGYVAIYGRE